MITVIMEHPVFEAKRIVFIEMNSKYISSLFLIIRESGCDS